MNEWVIKKVNYNFDWLFQVIVIQIEWDGTPTRLIIILFLITQPITEAQNNDNDVSRINLYLFSSKKRIFGLKIIMILMIEN